MLIKMQLYSEVKEPGMTDEKHALFSCWVLQEGFHFLILSVP